MRRDDSELVRVAMEINVDDKKKRDKEIGRIESIMMIVGVNRRGVGD